MLFTVEMSRQAGPGCLPFHALVDEIRGPACLVADEGQRVISCNGKALALLKKDRPLFCPSTGSGESADFSEDPFPISAADLSRLVEILGPPRIWPLWSAGEACSLLIFSEEGNGEKESAGRGMFTSGSDGADEDARVLPDRFGWNRKTFVELFSKSPVPFLYVEGLNIRRGNPALCSLLGCDERWLIGKNLEALFRIPERDEGQFFRALEQVDGNPCVLTELALCKKDGDLVEITAYAIPFTKERGKPAHSFFIQEVSEKKELERLLVRNSMVVTRSPLVLFQGEVGERIFLNYVSENVAQFGYSADEMMNRDFPFYSLIHPEDLDRVPQKATRDRDEGMDREYLFRMRDPAGKYHWMSLRDRIIPGEEGEVDKVVGVILDVTARKEAEIALLESHQETRAQLLRLQAAWEQTIELLAGVTELRDPYTMGHQRRVAHLAGALAGEMGLGEDEVQEVIRAGLVHDIGKIKVPSEFLSKPGKLAEREFAIIREHPNIGGELLKNIELPWPLSDIVLQHHERMDGSGYPQGLTGDAILPAARIIAVADVVEAMASHRPYRPALGIDKALGEITVNAGRLYDAEVVAACNRLFHERGYRLPDV